MSGKLKTALTTTLTLVEQFQPTLSSRTNAGQPTPTITDEQTKDSDPLALLSASATALKSHVTKLSLLTLTSPFTASAVATTLSTLNESVLPSLVTAALLVTPESHTAAFQSEIRILTGTALKDFFLLVKEVQVVAEDKASKKGLDQLEKDTVTLAAGRVWDACDTLIDVATKGVVGFVVQRAEEYRALVRDAVEEIEAWDPDEEGDEFFDELLDAGADMAGDDSKDDESDEEGSAALHKRKKDALRMLKPIAQIYPAIITNRLKKAPVPLTPSTTKVIETLMKNLQQIPEHIDEVAGALYEDDLDKYTRQVGKTKDCSSKAINLVALPWAAKRSSVDEETEGDKFTTWSKTWLKVVGEVSKSIDESSKSRIN
ncbi:hypothetical protein ASPCAL03580 [Aspergillus calidoustus]|uniref:Cyclin-D1-binding protein 1-like N-terminal domain-containing protein n=1 Tax=Aspergillus calidoustus TaxID=454130 RepID=A0A0U5C3V9_ASPCI|nr:hypothetical protein ASPCAL03580 [Aspergillus calidoustus]